MAALLNARLEARLSQDVYALIKRAAELEGRSVSDFVVSAAASAAQKTVRETSVVYLSVADQVAFAQALIDAPEPNAALTKAFNQRRLLLEE